jgi:hypothetical protein
VLLAIENAPPGTTRLVRHVSATGRASGLSVLGRRVPGALADLTDEQFFSYGWRIPFLASAVLVLVWLYVRLTITETPVFRSALTRGERVRVPMLEVLREFPWHPGHRHALLAGNVCPVLPDDGLRALPGAPPPLDSAARSFCSSSSSASSSSGCSSRSAHVLAARGRKRTLIWVTVAIGLFGLVSRPMFQPTVIGATATLAVGLSLMGSPTALSGPCSQSSSDIGALHRKFADLQHGGIFGASLAPYIATYLATRYGLQYVGYYLTAAAALTLVGLVSIRRTKDADLSL